MGVIMVWGRLKELYQRVWERRGYERETAVLVIKSALAATLALAVGMPLDPSGSFVGFAPFSALLIVQPSVYGAVQQSWRYVAAVVAGALFAGAGGLTVGLEIWSFALTQHREYLLSPAFSRFESRRFLQDDQCE